MSSGFSPERFSLVVSNAAFLLPISFLAVRRRPVPWLEVCTATAIMVFSMLWHWCSLPGEWSGSFCLFGNAESEEDLDFIASNEAVPLILLFSVPRGAWWKKAALYLGYAGTTAVLVADGGYTDAYPYLYEALAFTVVVVVLALAGVLQLAGAVAVGVAHTGAPSSSAKGAGVNAHALVWAALYSGGALALKIIGDEDIGLAHWIGHSLWHIGAAVGMYYALQILDPPDALHKWGPTEAAAEPGAVTSSRDAYTYARVYTDGSDAGV